MERPTDYLHAILANDRATLTDMYRRFFPMVRKLVFENSGSEADARDVFQEAVMVIFQKAKQPGFVLTSQFSTFLYGIAQNRWLNRRKKKSSHEVMIPEEAKYIPDDAPEPGSDDATEQRLLLYRAFAQLGETCQTVLRLFFEKKTMAEIAQAAGIADADTAAVKKHRCQKQLIELVKAFPEYRELRIR